MSEANEEVLANFLPPSLLAGLDLEVDEVMDLAFLLAPSVRKFIRSIASGPSAA